jgi:hypothetical protein
VLVRCASPLCQMTKQAVLLPQQRLQEAGLRPGDAVLVPSADAQGRSCCCVGVAWPSDAPVGLGTGAEERLDPCVRVAAEAPVVAACTSAFPVPFRITQRCMRSRPCE